MIYYRLDGETPVEAANVIEWAEFFGSDDRIVEQTYVGQVKISTVFLGINHSFGDGPPLLFETMIFDGEFDGEQWRYSTMEQARAGHTHAVELVLSPLKSSAGA